MDCYKRQTFAKINAEKATPLMSAGEAGVNLIKLGSHTQLFNIKQLSMARKKKRDDIHSLQ